MFSLVMFLLGALLLQAPQAVVEGTVLTTGTNEPIRGALVLLTAASAETVQTTSDNEGHFRVSVNPRQYHLFARKPGFVGEEEGQRLENTGVAITLVAGQRSTGTVLRLVPTGVITGRVFD